MNRRRRVTLWLVAAAVGATAGVLHVSPASAHGAMMKPGNRTYLCWKDGLNGNGAIQPRNPACAAAVAQSGPNSLYNWFAQLRSDGAGRVQGFIPDGKLCSANATVYDFSGFDLARNDWPVTHLTAGASMQFDYSNWAAHPGTFSLYITRDGFDPLKPLAWGDLEPTPFLQVTNPAMVGSPGTADGHYYWTGRLPSNKSGRHIIYSVWARSDSTETFYNCSDVVFDGGNGEVTGIGGGGPSSPPPSSPGPSSPGPSSPGPSSPGSSSPGPSSPGPQPGACTATYQIVSSWQGGFQAQVTVSNPGSAAIGRWSVSWDYAGGQSVTQGWNATVSQSGQRVTATNAAWNGTVPARGSTSFGLLANGTSSPAPQLACA